MNIPESNKLKAVVEKTCVGGWMNMQRTKDITDHPSLWRMDFLCFAIMGGVSE